MSGVSALGDCEVAIVVELSMRLQLKQLMGAQLFELLMRRRKYLGTRSTAPLRDTHGSTLGRQGPS